jgi:hypothetical protein
MSKIKAVGQTKYSWSVLTQSGHADKNPRCYSKKYIGTRGYLDPG